MKVDWTIAEKSLLNVKPSRIAGSIVVLPSLLKSSIVDKVVVGEDGGSRSWILLNEELS